MVDTKYKASKSRSAEDEWIGDRVRTVGHPPGTVLAKASSQPSTMEVVAYSLDDVIVKNDIKAADLGTLPADWPVVWINITGLGNTELLMELAGLFGLHRLAIEDVVNAHQRAKFEPYDEGTFIVARTVHAEQRLRTQQLSIFLVENVVISFEEIATPLLEHLRERINQGHALIRKAGPDFLVYCLLDAAIDSYFPALLAYDDMLEEIEESITAQFSKQRVQDIHAVRRDLLVLRRSIWPMRDMVNQILRDNRDFFTQETRLYLRDCLDHTIHIVELLEGYREMAHSMLDLQLTTLNHRMNEVMRVLTVIATVFIPLTFITSLYGMNFNYEVSPWNMPELHWKYGYVTVLAGMAAVASLLVAYFWRRGWLRDRYGSDS